MSSARATGIVICPGTIGSGCPCANFGAPGSGCGNSSNPNGASLSGAGNANNNATDSLVLTCTGMPSASTCIFFSGTNVLNGGMGVPFGDGLRCIGNPGIVQFSIKSAVAGTASYPVGIEPQIHIAEGLLFGPQTRAYQVWYRNGATYCTPLPFNTSNGLWIAWS